MEEFTLTDLVEEHIISELQELLLLKNGIESGVHCSDGRYLTNSINVCEFCELIIKRSEEGKRRCQNCDRENAQIAVREGKARCYKCHAGLVDFTAPIVVDDELFGYVVGGQISTEEVSYERCCQLAEELKLDADSLYEASKKIPIITQDRIDRAVRDADRIAGILSGIAKNKYELVKSYGEIEAAAKMKSDFLANMSHEIRTPMNAIIGMADMALREGNFDIAKSYIRQIKRSSNMLLAIINDILDFSKIESGKMDISMVEYSPMRILEDIVHILQTRIKDKNVVLTIDADPKLPGILMGDDIRIRQVITNLANNAVKFTNDGEVKITAFCEELGPMQKLLKVSVKDTGIGIKKHDLQKIFDSFQQVDSKRNRNIEGTGLGLAISKKLIELMGGKLFVESEYGVGSNFYFEIPQLEMHAVPQEQLEPSEDKYSVLFLNNPYEIEQLSRDITRLGIKMDIVQTKQQLLSIIGEVRYLFIDSENMDGELQRAIDESDRLTTVKLVKIDEEVSKKSARIRLMHKPVYTYRLLRIYNNEEMELQPDEDENIVIDFEAPEAKILVVDDNEINLSVCAGLLKPLNMQIELAHSGIEAIDRITEGMYDLIFMDHMMPEMDGIETTRIIRRLHEEYNEVPIIALTANALESAKSMFLTEGMNDFMSKPIDFKEMLKMLRRWLPKSKIVEISPEECPAARTDTVGETIPQIPGIDTEGALRLIGSASVYMELLKKYYTCVEQKSAVIESSLEQKDWARYTTEVHALKSSSRQLGAMELGELAAGLEQAGHDLDIATIMAKTPELIAEYHRIEAVLSQFVQTEDETVHRHMEKDEIISLLSGILDAVDDLDADKLKEMVNLLSEGDFDEAMRSSCMQLSNAVDMYDFDRCEAIANEWLISL